MTSPPRCSPEWPLIGLVTLLGAVLRLWSVDRLGLTHFDEGMYAMAALWVTLPRGLAEIDPAAALYAPPGFATLVGLGYFFFGIADLVPILVSIAAGIAAIPLTAILARQIFGAGAGVMAATLAALSGPHIAFSRMALTDALFLDMWLLAMIAGYRFLDRPGAGRAIGLGLTVGLAQNVKYNGGLAGIIVALAAGIDALRQRVRSAALRSLGRLMTAGGVAGLMYLPWAWYVERHVGYAKLAAHHRGYAGGIATWPGHLLTQLAETVALSPPFWLGAAGLLAAFAAVARLVWKEAGPSSGRRIVPLAALLLGGCPTGGWWVAIVWAPWLLVDTAPGRRLLGCWVVALTAITPFYHPYARLWLPLDAAGWITASGALLGLWRGGSPGGGISQAVVPVAMGLALGQALLAPPAFQPLGVLLAPTDSFRRHLAEASPDPRATDGEYLLLLARPHASLYLVMGGRVPFQKMSGLDQLLREARPGAWALVDEVMLRQEGDAESARQRLLKVFEPVHEWTETLPPPTLLDISPEAAFGDTSARESRWTLLRPRSTPGTPPAG